MSRPFHNRFNAPRLSPEQVDRQSRVMRLALAALPPADVMPFLNTPDPQLGGRPLEVAIASAGGFTLVEERIARGV
jgi:uncharacterized protein (DUF2384 family)